MFFIPKKKEFRKLQKKKVKISASRNNTLSFGDFGLKIKENYFLTSSQLEMIRIFLSKEIKKVGKFWLKVYPQHSVTSKPLEVRMGKGKGHISSWICKLKAGTLFVEVAGLSKARAVSLLKKLAVKLPFKALVVLKQ